LNKNEICNNMVKVQFEESVLRRFYFERRSIGESDETIRNEIAHIRRWLGDWGESIAIQKWENKNYHVYRMPYGHHWDLEVEMRDSPQFYPPGAPEFARIEVKVNTSKLSKQENEARILSISQGIPFIIEIYHYPFNLVPFSDILWRGPPKPKKGDYYY